MPLKTEGYTIFNLNFNFRSMNLFISYVLPVQFRILGWIALLFSLPLGATYGAIVAIMVIITCLVIITASYEVEVNNKAQYYRNLVSILGGGKFGKKHYFDAIQYCFITKGRYNQELSAGPANTTIVFEKYNGYLKFSDDEKILIATKKTRKELLGVVNSFRIAWDIELMDYTRDDSFL